MLFTYHPYASIKGVKATEEAFSPQKRIFQNMNFLNFFYFRGSFLPSGIRVKWPDWIQIQSGPGSETLLQAIGDTLHYTEAIQVVTG